MQPSRKNAYETLKFRPLAGPSRVYPPLVVNGIQVSGFVSEVEPLYVQGNLTDILVEIYPRLSLPELARLAACLEKLKIDSSELLSRYGLRPNEILQQVFQFLLVLPEEVQDYLSEKEVHLGDVRSLIPPQSDFSNSVAFLSHCVLLRMSKSQLVEAVGLANELMSLGDFLWEPQLGRDQLMEDLKRRRFPMATKRDDERSVQTRQQKWPLRSQVKWTRHGDLSGLEIKFFVSSPSEYGRAVADLSKVPPEDIWK